MTRLFPLFLVAVTIFATSPSRAEDASDDRPIDDIPHITIIGTAETEVAPDIATIMLGVTTEKSTATAVTTENAKKAQAVIDMAKAQGVAPADIATQSVTLTQTFDNMNDPQGRFIGRKPRGFAAENIIAIKVRDLTKAGALAESLIEKGANRFDGIDFSIDHPEPILDKLTGEAVKRARAQAQIAADAAGVRLGRVLLIERPGEQTSGRPILPSAVRMKATAAPMPVEAGTTTLSRQVEVTWALDTN